MKLGSSGDSTLTAMVKLGLRTAGSGGSRGLKISSVHNSAGTLWRIGLTYKAATFTQLGNELEPEMNFHLLCSTTTMTAAWETFQRSLPKAPNVDVKQIRGNISDAEKQINANVLAYFTTGSGISPFPPFGNEISGRLRMVELNLWDAMSTGSSESEVVLEIQVTENMCNVYGTMHGGCAAFILDPCTVSAMVLLGLAKGFDGTGVSQAINVHWHHPALLGSTLTVTTRSVFADGRARLARCEIREKLTGKLIVSGTHTFLNAGRATKL
ncbi:HotDog domain-containing protein [Mycena alexandri]|uniref:HotDog domain-containing protein n=1 Tax=Mycena alexandri TaxID=1745969 RepID=A0AAD6WRC3_9AGAR|nr:HotDog domain-containing protein [Mycena alexandri]